MQTIITRYVVAISLLISFSAASNATVPLELYGQLTQGAMVRAKTAANTTVHLDDQVLQVSDSGDFVFGFGHNAPATAVLKVYLSNGDYLEKILTITQRQYPIQRIDGLAEHQVTPPPQVYDRISKESAMIGQVRRRHSYQLDAFDEFLWPTAGIITGVYGSQRILNGKPRSPHYGVDIASDVGSPVLAPAGGVVTLIHDMYFSGLTMVIDHGYGVSSTFLHLDKVLVALGSRVERGQPVAQVGASGRVTGAHLDWRVNWFERRLDPQLIAAPRD